MLAFRHTLQDSFSSVGGSSQQKAQRHGGNSAAFCLPCREEFGSFKTKSTSTSCKLQASSCQITAWREAGWQQDLKDRGIKFFQRKIWRGAGTLTDTDGHDPCARVGNSTGLPFHSGRVCPEMRLQKLAPFEYFKPSESFNRLLFPSASS